MKTSELENKINTIITESLFHSGGTKSPKIALLELGATEELENFRFILNEFIILVNGMSYTIHIKKIDSITEAKKYFEHITEKKIAYNYFFQYHINYENYIEGLEEKIVKSINNNEDLKKKRIKINVLVDIVKQNLKNYMDNYFIADSFNTINEKIQYIA